MLVKTRGIVLGYIRYGETSIIVRIYTEDFGTQSYIVNGARTKKSNKIGLYQPLNFLELVVYSSNKSGGLHRISESHSLVPFFHIPTDFTKTTIALFLAEILDNVLRQESPHDNLFEFLLSSFSVFDLQTVQPENFHLRFLLKLCRFLGFEPASSDDFYNQIYKTEHRSWQQIVPEAEFTLPELLLKSAYTDALPINNMQRRHLLEQIIRFYEIHLDNWHTPRSLEVLRSLY